MSDYKSSQNTASSAIGEMKLDKLGVRRFSLADPYHLALSLTWPEFFAALLLIYLAINAGFGLLYFAAPGSVSNLPAGSLVDAFFFSVETLATVGYGTMSPTSLYGHIVATTEIFVGMLFTATMTGLFFVRFSKPKARILFADRPVLARRDGRPVLMIRIGNGRINTLTDATARLTALVVERDEHGQMFRRAVDLKLVRADFPLFPLTWTVMHELDASSPIAGLSPESAQSASLRLMLSVSARDPSLGAHVHDGHTYRADDIAFGMRYVDAVSWDGHDRSVADMRKLSLVELDPASGGGGLP
ncbi:MAG TPA: ion channel [Caldimonas sp.]|nr:ion channel [Caldimonas sp.]